MNANRLPLFCDIALAERIERAEAQLMAECTEAASRRTGDTVGFVIAVAGGVASFAETDSPFNKVAGLGFGGLPSAAVLDEVERAFTACGAPVQVELAHLVDPAIGILLTERGYRLESFENVLGLALDGKFERVTPPGVEIRRSGDEEFDAWLDVVADGAAQGTPCVSGTGPSPAGPASARRPRAETPRARRRPRRDRARPSGWQRASRSSPARRPHLRTGAGVSSPRCSRPGSPTPLPPAATSP
jgi:hypothetical protein